MTSRKPASSKRAPLPRASDYTRTFLKDWERLSRSGRYDLKRLKEAMLLHIGNDAPLGPEWLDHPLKGDWVDHRECHIGGDFLLLYRLDGNAIIFVRAGTHSELFEELTPGRRRANRDQLGLLLACLHQPSRTRAGSCERLRTAAAARTGRSPPAMVVSGRLRRIKAQLFLVEVNHFHPGLPPSELAGVRESAVPPAARHNSGRRGYPGRSFSS